MPKFKVGDKVVLPSDNILVPKEFSGLTGTVTQVHAEMQVKNRPSDPWVPTYMVQFQGEDDAMLIEEDWLEFG